MMLRMIGESTCVFVFSNAIGLNVFHTYLGSFGKVPFVNHCGVEIWSVEGLDQEITLSILRSNMKVANTFGDGIRVHRSKHQFHWAWFGSCEFSITMQHVLLVSATHVGSSVDLCSDPIWVIVKVVSNCFDLNIGSWRQ